MLFRSSILHKPATGAVVPGSPTRKQGKENTSPAGRLGEFAAAAALQNPAALSRQEIYQARDQPPPTIRKYNTQRGLTAEELEILQKPNVKRLANVTQLCEFDVGRWFWECVANWNGRFPRLLL